METLAGILVAAILLLYPTWRMFQRAGLPPAGSLVVLIPTIGLFVALYWLAFAKWPNGRGFIR